MWESAASLGVVLFSGWVPGTEIIRSGADALSREEGLDWHGWGVGGIVGRSAEGMVEVNAGCQLQGVHSPDDGSKTQGT